jgi:hypothetical protein
MNNLVDQHIYDSCVNLGLCRKSNYSFSRFLGRSPSYFSTICITRKSISADSLLRLSQRLSRLSQMAEPSVQKPVQQLSEFVRNVAFDRAAGLS